jgi:Spy/CpxP family protein refolding chaperone
MIRYQFEHSWPHTLFFGLFAFSFIAAGQAWAKDMPAGKWWHTPMIAAGLNLTGSDKDALDNLYARNHAKLTALNATVKKEHIKLEGILEENTVDEYELDSQFNRMEEARKDLDSAQLKYTLGVRNILGPDRFKQFFVKPQEVKDAKPKHSKSRKHAH